MKKLLIVVDYQNDFVTGTLGFDRASLIEDYIVSTINLFLSNNDDVIFTKDTHHENYLSTCEGESIPVKHCIKGSVGHDLYGKIINYEGKGYVIEKNTFPSKELCHYLMNKTYTEITLIGVVTNICVLSNAIIAKAALPEAKIIIDARGCASNDVDLERKAYDVARGLTFEVINENR